MWSVNLGVPAIAFSDSCSKDKLTWRLAFDQKFSAGVVGYVSYRRGYKIGGFNLLDVGALNRPTGHVSPSYNPEIVDAYEVGLKSDLFDRRLRLIVAALYYDYKDIQLQDRKIVV